MYEHEDGCHVLNWIRLLSRASETPPVFGEVLVDKFEFFKDVLSILLISVGRFYTMALSIRLLSSMVLLKLYLSVNKIVQEHYHR